jgi:FtsZ-interacting cell division protein ZipA
MNLLFNNLTNINIKLSADNGLFTAIKDMFNISSNTSGYLIYLLIMLGVLLIIAVLIYNWWEERRFNIEVESNFSPIESDALLNKNKQEFLDKFAATTGYLNDAPENSPSIAVAGEALEESKSIEDVYSELLETMSNRPTEVEDVDVDGKVTINHDNIEEHNLKNEVNTSNLDQILYIPEEVSADSQNLDKEIGFRTSPATNTQDSIKDIISQAFSAEGLVKASVESASDRVENDSDDEGSLRNKQSTTTVNVLDEGQPTIKSEAHHFNAELGSNNLTVNSAAATKDFVKSDFKAILAETKSVDESKDEQSRTSTFSSNNAKPSTTQNNSAEQFNKRKTDLPEKEALFTPSFASTLPATLNAHIDLIGTVVMPNGTTTTLLFETFSNFHKDYDKPVFVFLHTSENTYTLINDVELSMLAQLVNPSQETHITAGIQLADRTGPASKNTINRFQSSFELIASNLKSKVNWRDNDDPLYKASALDAFCIDVDKTMFFHLTDNGKGPFTGTKLKGLVEGQGMELADNGHYQYFDVESNDQSQFRMPEFVMFNRDNHPFNHEMLRSSVIKAVTFQLDIPHINASGTALDRMVIIAKSLEDNLNVQLVDDQNRPLGTLHIDKIREQVKSIHATMQLRGITPGSEFAHRLFS